MNEHAKRFASTGDIGIARLAGVVRRHKWKVSLTAALIAAAGVAWVWRMPSVYQATAVVRIDDPRPSREYVDPTVNEPGVERLKSARRALLARPVILSAAEQVGLVAPTAADEDKTRLIARLAARLDARQEGDDAFVLTYEDEDPARAGRFLQAVSEAYAASRADEMGRRAAAAAAFFAREVEALRPRAAEAQAVVEKFRLQHHGSLPEQLEGNLRILDETQMQLASLRSSLDSALNRKRAILADAISPIRGQEEDVARALSQARLRYAAGAPELAALEEEYQRVRTARVADEVGAGGPDPAPPGGGAARARSRPSIDEEELARETRRSPELRAVEEEIVRLRGLMDELEERKAAYVDRVEAAARNGEQLARLALERDVLRDRLKSLMQKHEEASLAAGLEAGVSGAARVAVVEPAWVSSAPVKPSKPLYAVIALFVASVVGLGVGLAADAWDGRVRGPADVRALTGDVTILGVVPKARRA